MSIISEQTDAQSYVPEVFSKIGVRPTSCQLTVKKVEGNKTHYTYQLHWESEGEPEGAPLTLADLTAALSNSNTKLHPLQNNDYEAETEKKKAKSPSVKKRRSLSSHQQLLLCDGPCGKKYAPSGLHFLGRCDHRLCNLCSGIVTNLDGSQGCSAMSCTIFRVYDFLPEPLAKEAYENQIRKKFMEREKMSNVDSRNEKANLIEQPISVNFAARGAASGIKLTVNSTTPPRRNESNASQSSRRSVVSGISSKGTASTNNNLFSDLPLRSTSQVFAPDELENVFVRLMVLERLSKSAEKKVYKRVVEEEMAATTTVKAAIGALLGDRSNLLLTAAHAFPIRLYFYAGLKGDRMRKLCRDEYEKKALLDFTRNRGPVHFVLDAADGVKKI